MTSYPRRTAAVTRNTKETKIQLSLSLDGGPLDLLEETSDFDSSDHQGMPRQDSDHHASQVTDHQHIWIWTGVGFLDHMLHALAKHAGWSLRLRSRGDLLSMQLFLLIQSGYAPKLCASIHAKLTWLSFCSRRSPYHRRYLFGSWLCIQQGPWSSHRCETIRDCSCTPGRSLLTGCHRYLFPTLLRRGIRFQRANDWRFKLSNDPSRPIKLGASGRSDFTRTRALRRQRPSPSRECLQGLGTCLQGGC